jgi:hypothetical protein
MKNTVANIENISRKIVDTVDYEAQKVAVMLGANPEIKNA